MSNEEENNDIRWEDVENHSHLDVTDMYESYEARMDRLEKDIRFIVKLMITNGVVTILLTVAIVILIFNI